MTTNAVEDYLKAIFGLEEEHGRVGTTALATALRVATASVTGMLQKLAEAQPRLVNYERHRGVALTSAGRKIALEVIRHHRLIELYLTEALGYPWDEVDAEAERLEHVISEDFEDRICAILGDPTRDPHGNPIPSKDGTLPPLSCKALTEVDPGQTARVARVRDDDPALLRYLAELGLTLDANVTVAGRAPFEGPMHIRVGEGGSETHALGRVVTDQVFVAVDEGPNSSEARR